jgi:STE24 endopeptidase
VVLAAACSEAARRLLRPRGAEITPAEVDPRRYFSPVEIRRGARYARPQLAIGLAGQVIQLALLAGAVQYLARPGRRPLADRVGARPALGGALAAGVMSASGTLTGLPLGALARRRSLAVGLSTQSWRDWLLDVAKSSAIETGLATGAGAAIVSLTRRYPRGWWLPASAGAVGVAGLMGTLAPVFLDPVFNRFEPLPAGPVRSDVLELARAVGVSVGEVYEVDASRRTTGANAYVTGLGPSKRVVLFDTLLERYSRDEVRVVVAHELAHVRHRDVWRSLAYLALISPAAALAVQRVSWLLSPEPGTAEALPALALAAALVATPAGLIASRLSRAVERRADADSLEFSGAPEAFISFQRSVALQNVADVTPPRWVKTLLATHPTTTERIGVAVAYSASGGGPSAPPNSGKFLMPSRVSHLE